MPTRKRRSWRTVKTVQTISGAVERCWLIGIQGIAVSRVASVRVSPYLVRDAVLPCGAQRHVSLSGCRWSPRFVWPQRPECTFQNPKPTTT